MVNSELSTEQKIKEAAIKVFTAKGKSGARMQDIADEANINKAMLHYYFRNKEKLFELVFEEKLIELFSAFQVILSSQLDFEGKIRKFVEKEIDMISAYPMLPMFILNEVGKNPEIMANKFANAGPRIFKEYFKELVQEEIKSKKIRPIDYRQLLMNLMSLCIYPFLARSVIQNVMSINDKEFNEIIQERKKLVAELILNDLKINS
jgi:AcrR family transcriptional regulator